jgi:glycosyl transferase family 7 (putative galactosyltransferase)
MRDLSFVIPIRVDTPDRLENCGAILRFLTQHFPRSEIQLVEQDAETQTAVLRRSFPQVVWHFEFNDKHFSRGAAINTGLLRSTRRCVCAYDTDILINPAALRLAVSLIRSGRWPIVIPFNLIFVEVSGQRRANLIDSLDIADLSTITHLSHVPRHPEIASRVLSGAIMMCDREVVIMEGGYNRKMTSYGWEDIEFFKRFEKLGYYSYMLNDFNLIHLDHRRGPDSRVNEKYEINKREFDKVLAMSEAQLRAYSERELNLGPAVEPDRRRSVRKKRALNNWLTLRRAAHLANRAATIWRINGTQGFLRKVLHLGHTA